MRRVTWSDDAIDDLVGIRSYIGHFNSVAAARLADRIVAAAESLSEFSERGREIAFGVRQLSLIYPYQIRYRVSGGLVEILSVRHGARSDDPVD